MLKKFLLTLIYWIIIIIICTIISYPIYLGLSKCKIKQENKRAEITFDKEYLMHNNFSLNFITINNEMECVVFDRGISCNWEKYNNLK